MLVSERSLGAAAALRSRSTPVSKAIAHVLESIRTETGADLVIALRQERGAQGQAMVLAAQWLDPDLALTPSEPVAISPHLSPYLGCFEDLHIRSRIRWQSVNCTTGIAIPWRSRDESGWLIVANAHHANPLTIPTARARNYGRLLRQTYAASSIVSRNRDRLNLARAARTLAEAEDGMRTAADLLDDALVIGRNLLKTSTLYLSLPDSNQDVFTFSRHLGLRTSAFKRLRMGTGQGLGGVTRNERRTVRSLNYAQDFRERDAPVHETVREGICSAMCAPIIMNGQVSGLLYAGNRQLTAFSEDDAAMLEDFAGNVSVLFRRSELERVRQSSVRLSERHRLARDLHDTVARKLMEIGVHSKLAHGHGEMAAASHLQAIEEAAETCLAMIRQSIGSLSAECDGATRAATVADVMAALRLDNRCRTLDYKFECHSGVSRVTLPFNIASGLIRVGQEAIHNAEMHSGGKQVVVRIVADKKSISLTVEDDGQGIDEASLAHMLGNRKHLGLRQMRAFASENGGSCTLRDSDLGGLRVEAMVPLA